MNVIAQIFDNRDLRNLINNLSSSRETSCACEFFSVFLSALNHLLKAWHPPCRFANCQVRTSQFSFADHCTSLYGAPFFTAFHVAAIASEIDQSAFTKQQVTETIQDIQCRLQWDVGRECLIYSRSSGKWTDGHIVAVAIDESTNGEWLMVQYGDKMRKRIQRFSVFIRPKSLPSDYHVSTLLFQLIVDRLKDLQHSTHESEMILSMESSKIEWNPDSFSTQRIVANFIEDEADEHMIHIPMDIVHLVALYVNDWFSTDGAYRWKIEDPEMVHKMLTADNGQSFESPSFMMSRLKWKLKVYPNGVDEGKLGYLIIQLHLLSLPVEVEQIQICRTFTVEEDMSSSLWVDVLSQNGYDFWGKKCSLNELVRLNPQTLTIVAEIQINKMMLKMGSQLNRYRYPTNSADNVMIRYLMETTKSNPRDIEFVLSGEALELMKSADRFKEMCGDIVNGIWRLSVYPNGMDDDDDDVGEIGVYLHICQIPSRCAAIHTEFEVGCRETGDSDECQYKFCEPDSLGYGVWLLNIQDVKELATVTFYARIHSVRLEMKEIEDPYSISDRMVVSQILAE